MRIPLASPAAWLRIWGAILVVLAPGAILAARQRGAGPVPGGPPASELRRLAEGVYADIVGPDGDAVANAGVVVLASGVLIFDSHYSAEAAKALEDKVKAVTPRPVRYLVNSHFHPDHTHGNQAFAGVRQIIGSTAARRDMLQKDQPALNRMQVIAQAQVEQLSRELSQEKEAGRQEALRAQLNSRQAFMRRLSNLRIVPPLMTLDDTLAIEDGDRRVELRFLGAAHTEGDIILFLPREKIAFLGDLFFHEAIPNVEDAVVLDWMKALGEALKLDAVTFVPGHGPVGGRQDLEDFLRYFEDLKTMVEPAVARGDSLELLVQDARVPPRYAAHAFQNFFPSNLQKMYVELKSAQAAAAPKGKIIKVPRP